MNVKILKILSNFSVGIAIPIPYFITYTFCNFYSIYFCIKTDIKAIQKANQTVSKLSLSIGIEYSSSTGAMPKFCDWRRSLGQQDKILVLYG